MKFLIFVTPPSIYQFISQGYFYGVITRRMERLSCKAMITCLGWIDAASSLMYDDQAINSIDEFISLDDESIKNICKALRRYGVVTANGDL